MARGQWYVLGALLLLFSAIFFYLTSYFGGTPSGSEASEEIFKILSASVGEIKQLCFSGKILPQGYNCRELDEALIKCGVNLTYIGRDYTVKFYLQRNQECNGSFLLEAPNYTFSEIYLPGESCKSLDFTGNVSVVSWGCNTTGVVVRGGFYGRTFLCGRNPTEGSGVLPFKAFSFCSSSDLPEDFEEINLAVNPYAMPPSVLVICRNISYASYTLVKRVLQNNGVVVGYTAFCNSTHCGGLKLYSFPSPKAVKGLSVLSEAPLAEARFFVENCPEPLAVAEDDSSLAAICVFPYLGGRVIFLGSPSYITQDIIASLEEYLEVGKFPVRVRRCGE